MTTAGELRAIIRRPIEESSAAMAMAMSMFNKQQAQADAEVGKEMTKLAKRYVGILQAITGIKDGWTVAPTKHLLSIDNEDAGITIDIHWETDLATGKVDLVVELNRRKGPEGPRAKWRSKFHKVQGITPAPMNLSPAAVLGDSAVRRFLKENAEKLLAPLLEDDGWREGHGACWTAAGTLLEADKFKAALEKFTGKKNPSAADIVKAIVMKGVNSRLATVDEIRSMIEKEEVGMDIAALRSIVEGRNVLTEAKSLEEGVEKVEVPDRRPMFKARKVIHPDDQKQYSHAYKAARMGNNSSLIARAMASGPGYMPTGALFYATQALPKTLADAGFDVWHLGNEGGKDKWLALRVKGIKIDKAARKASWSAYGEPWELSVYMKKHGIPEGGHAAQYRKEEKSLAEDLRSLIEYKGTPYGKQDASKEADMWGSKHGEKKEVGARDKASGKRKRSGHSVTAKKAAHKGERQAAKKEILARMKGESLSLDDLGETMEQLGEAGMMANPMVRQLDTLRTVQDMAEQLGRFSTEFSQYLKKAMKKEQVDVGRLGKFGRRVDAAHSIFRRSYESLLREELEDGEEALEA